MQEIFKMMALLSFSLSIIRSQLSSKRGLLFDLDGTIVNSEIFHFHSYRKLLQDEFPTFNQGIPISREYYNEVGTGGTDKGMFQYLFPSWTMYEIEKYTNLKSDIFSQVARNLSLIHGLENFIRQADLKALKKIVVTNCSRRDATHLLQELSLPSLLEDIVISEECQFCKPHPSPYLEGLARLGLDASECVAFEDSKSGCQSSTSAGIFTVGICSTHSEDQLKSWGAAFAIQSYDDERLLDLFKI